MGIQPISSSFFFLNEKLAFSFYTQKKSKDKKFQQISSTQKQVLMGNE
jgi:hypothetical protein